MSLFPFNREYHQIVYADIVQQALELNKCLGAGMTVTGQGLEYSKHAPEGQLERVRILEGYGLDVQPMLKQFSKKQREDVLDAACLALSAQLGCQNGFQTIPEHPSVDRIGLKMQIAYGVD